MIPLHPERLVESQKPIQLLQQWQCLMKEQPLLVSYKVTVCYQMKEVRTSHGTTATASESVS